MPPDTIKVTVDTVAFAVQQDALEVLLVKRKYDPFKNSWALPGGFVTDEDDTIEKAAARELLEEERTLNRKSLANPDPFVWLAATWVEGALAAELGDAAGVEAAARRIETLRPESIAGLGTGQFAWLKRVFTYAFPAADVAASLRARLALLQGRWSDAQAALDGMSQARHFAALFGPSPDRLALDQADRIALLVRAGRDEEALRWASAINTWTELEPRYFAPLALERARIEERLGRRAQAAADYARVVQLWQDPDPELRPLLEEARRGLEQTR